jgi:hypothetical protein
LEEKSNNLKVERQAGSLQVHVIAAAAVDVETVPP